MPPIGSSQRCFPSLKRDALKSYPSIPHTTIADRPVYLFAKLDGSNIRAEWSRGQWRLGSRRKLLDRGILAEEVPDLMAQTFSEPLEAIFRQQKWSKVVAYFEFHGPGSFAGQHEDEPHILTLIDVGVHRKGILLPSEFLTRFAHLPHAELLHHGQFTPALQRQVEDIGSISSPPKSTSASTSPSISPSSLISPVMKSGLSVSPPPPPPQKFAPPQPPS